MKSIFLVFVMFVALVSCNKKSVESGDTMYLVDFKKCLQTERPMNLSEIADTLEYLELKTPEDIIITRIFNIIQLDDFFFILSRDGLFKFTRKGEYITTMGRKGQGPGEYNQVFDIEVDPVKREFIIADSEQTLFYDLDGKFLRREKTGTLFRIAVSDSILWAAGLAHRTMQFIAFALNPARDTIAAMPNPHYGMKSLDAGMGVSYSKFLKPFYRYKGGLYLKGKEMNDTIFRLSDEKRIPYVTLNMGKYKLPIEYEPWYSYDVFLKNGFRYWGIPAVAEDDRYLYLRAQRHTSIDGDNYGNNEENFRYILFDKEKQEGFVTNGPDGTRFTDDILGAPPFWPHWTGDDYYMNTIDWYNLSQELKNGNYTLSPAFRKQFDTWGYDTNALIILAHKKK
jgi:hypothetical protein